MKSVVAKRSIVIMDTKPALTLKTPFGLNSKRSLNSNALRYRNWWAELMLRANRAICHRRSALLCLGMFKTKRSERACRTREIPSLAVMKANQLRLSAGL
jgi:hypothetical protein